MKERVFCCLVLGVMQFVSVTVVWAQIVYHGSSLLFETPEPQENTRLAQGKVIWQGEAVFGTYDSRIAVLYTAKRWPSNAYGFGVDLVTKTPEHKALNLVLYGSKIEDTVESILDNLYGKKERSVGFLYCMDEQSFVHEQGLGQMEVISKTKPQLIENEECVGGVQRINPRVELEVCLKAGSTRVVLHKKE